MSLEIKVRKERWEVLQKIKEESFRVVSGEPVKYWVQFGFWGAGSLEPANEIKALEKLEELGVISILNPGGTGEYE